MRGRAGPVTEVSVFATDILVTGMKIFPYNWLQPGDRDETFSSDKIASLSQHSGENGIIYVLYVSSTSGVCESALSVSYQSSQSYDGRERYKFMFHHFGCVSQIHPCRPG